MSSRKPTPDVLGEILGDPTSVAPESDQGDAMTRDKPLARPAKARSRRTPSAKAQDEATKWEILEIVFRDYRGWRPKVVNGAELSNWKEAPVLYEYLRALGKEGWELVSVGNAHRNEKEAYLKRPSLPV